MNRLMAVRPVLRSMIRPNVVAVQQRFSSHDHYESKDIGPPASFNQLPQPEGDWAENHKAKQVKYNGVLAAAALFFAATIGYLKSSGVIYFNAFPPDSIE